jgi:hypothetical protein
MILIPISGTAALLTSVLLFGVFEFVGNFDWNKATLEKEYMASVLLLTEARPMPSNAFSTFSESLALVLKCSMLGYLARKVFTCSSVTCLSASLSILLPRITKGNFYGSLGAPWLMNSSFQVSKFWKL